MTEIMIVAATLFWLTAQTLSILQPDNRWSWPLKADAALCLLAALILK